MNSQELIMKISFLLDRFIYKSENVPEYNNISSLAKIYNTISDEEKAIPKPDKPDELNKNQGGINGIE